MRLWQVEAPSHRATPEDALATVVGGLGGPGPCRTHRPRSHLEGQDTGNISQHCGAVLGWAESSLQLCLALAPPGMAADASTDTGRALSPSCPLSPGHRLAGRPRCPSVPGILS